MDAPSGFRQRKSGQRRAKAPRQPRNQPQNPQLFDDTSSYPPQYGTPGQGGVPKSMNPAMFRSIRYGMPPGQQYGQQQPYPGQQIFNDPMANMAMQYGTSLADQGKEYVHKNLEKYVATSKLKYYFAVDTTYVAKKLGLVLFPYSHTDWSMRYNQDEPVAPRYEVNAPDLYIPVMAFVTYLLVAGLVLGTQSRFTPEQLGIQASSSLVWVVIEIIAFLFTLYVMNIKTDLKYLDLIAFSGYKFVGMIFSLLCGLIFQGSGYYIVLLYTSISVAFFLVRTLKVQVLPHADPDSFSHGNKRRMYLLLFIAGVQPILMWWLSSHIMFYTPKPQL
ncbi:protein YIF1B-B-like isoform X3 [Tubulanus polymorphus]|uniref:protein YIF1B-B-like isoform X3 n=1 Tax=Tubulanus polymorphus TaxID=672921 RepID=UPI003DA5D357